MVLWPESYANADAELDPGENMSDANLESETLPEALPETEREKFEAQEIVECILTVNGMEVRPMKSAEEGWTLPNEGEHWYNRDDELISVPDMSSRFEHL